MISDQVLAMDLYSSNETLDDIATTDLKYLLTDAYLCDFGLKLSFQEPLERLDQLKEFQQRAHRFLSTMKALELLADQEEAYYEELMGPPVIKSAEKIRADKIARFKREREIKSKMEVFLFYRLMSKKGTQGIACV